LDFGLDRSGGIFDVPSPQIIDVVLMVDSNLVLEEKGEREI